jgi:PHP family Zn ribbon phosphoesterase
MNTEKTIGREKAATCGECYKEYKAEDLGETCPFCGGIIVDPKLLPNY